MSKPIHVAPEMHKAIKTVSARRERPMKELVTELLRGEADQELIEAIKRELDYLEENPELLDEPVEDRQEVEA